MAARSALAVALLGALGACGAEPIAPSSDAGPSDDAGPLDAAAPDAAAPDAQPMLVEGAPLPAVQIPLGPADPSALLLPSGLIARRDGEAWWIGTSTDVRLERVGRLTGGVELGGGTALVLAEDGARIWTGERLVPSAIADALEGNAPLRAVRADDGALWIATRPGLYVYATGEARRVTPSGLPSADARLAFGAPIGGRPRTWVAAEGRLFAIDTQRAAVDLGAPSAVEALAIDGQGALWLRAAGQLHRRDAAGAWAHDGLAITSVGPGWVARSSGLARVEGGALRAIEDLEPSAVLVAADDRRAIVHSGGALFEVVPGAIAVVGLAEGDVLTASTAVAAYGLGGAPTLTLDGAPLRARSLRGGSVVTIPAAALVEGPHTLEVQSGADTRTIRFASLSGGVPTWTNDVQPFFRDRCYTCHRSGGNAHTLDGVAYWRAEIDRILAEVRARRMPLPPYAAVNARELAMLEGWRSAGLPE